MEWIGYLIGGIGIIIGVIGVTLFLLSQKEVKNLINQLEEINSKETNQRVQISGGNKQYKQLAISINQIIEARKNTQKEYMRMERELREAIANISHDLRTPLTSILGYLQLLEKGQLEAEKQKQYLNVIQGRAENLKGLIENFYELSKLNSGTYPLEYQRIHIDRIFCELMANFYQDFMDKNLKLQMNIEENLPSIWTDEKAITRILLNLIQNTLRYAKKDIKVNISEEEKWIKVAITNEAGELKEEDIPQLFDRFFMANRVRNGKGTGVGLAVVKKLASMINAEVGAELEEQRVTIWVSFIKDENK